MLMLSKGTPLADLKPLNQPSRKEAVELLPLIRGKADLRGPDHSDDTRRPIRGPGSIMLVRSRMLYARAALNAKGNVQFGLRHIRKHRCCT